MAREFGGPSPEEMGVETQRPGNFETVLNDFKRGGRPDDETLQELVSMSKGVDHVSRPDLQGKDIRKELYPGWSDGDFKALLDELGYDEEGNII
jgi:hypothetical protein